MKKTLLVLMVSVGFALQGFAQGAGTKQKTTAEPTTEQRTQMAAMHEKAAQCLRSTKTMDECHTEMMKDCPMGEKCTMGMGMGTWKKEGMGKGKKGMMGKGGTSETGTETDTTKEKQSY